MTTKSRGSLQRARAQIEAFATAKLDELADKSLYRTLKPTQRYPGAGAERDRVALVSFSDNDYLGLSQDERVRDAAAQAARRHGTGAGASRLITGDNPLNHQVEETLARMKGMEAGLVFGSGYLANISTIPVLVGKQDLVVLDELSHACMHAGAKLSGATVRRFRHNDTADAARQLEMPGARRKLLLTETVFSMDGDLAPLAGLAEVCEQQDAWLMTDDAHGFGVVEQDNPAPIQMGTLSKSAGAYGGYVTGPRALIDLLVNRARGFIFTTGLPPATLAAALKALNIMEEEPERARTALDNARLFCRLIGAPEPRSTIVPVILGDEETALRASDSLFEAGFLVTAIRPPTVPEGTARLRVAFSATHNAAQVEGLAREVARFYPQAAAQ